MYTNLQLAIQKNETDRIDHLLQTERVDIHETNNCNENALFFACRRKMLDLARTLLERGADMHVVTLRGETAFSHAVQSDDFQWGNMRTIRLLVEFGLEGRVRRALAGVGARRRRVHGLGELRLGLALALDQLGHACGVLRRPAQTALRRARQADAAGLDA